ncbi:hypothetical protein L2E82_01516 [Cichorium intybus]|uniref:Uncharacterized protein n=1 Tax=Cichorium intybus TaxID=13427 RepID=A0ACB9GZW9_CICIN|nr:hypothetical protein L2E82_01516 [Cichorium intybus]
MFTSGDIFWLQNESSGPPLNAYTFPEGEGEKIDLEVHNFIGAGGVALSIYNTDEEFVMQLLKCLLLLSMIQIMIATFMGVEAASIETKASRDHQGGYHLTKQELSDIQHGKDSGKFSL